MRHEEDAVQDGVKVSLLLHILRESRVRGQSWSPWPGHSPGKKDGHLTISRIPGRQQQPGLQETAGSVYIVS